MAKLLIILISFLSGVASSTQGLYNGYWQKIVGLKAILLVNAVVVLLAVVIFYLVTAEEGVKISFDKMTPSILVGGVCGFFVIMAFTLAFPAIGATATALFFIAGFLVSSFFFDYTGALNLTVVPFSLHRVVGILLVIAGSYIALRNPA